MKEINGLKKGDYPKFEAGSYSKQMRKYKKLFGKQEKISIFVYFYNTSLVIRIEIPLRGRLCTRYSFRFLFVKHDKYDEYIKSVKYGATSLMFYYDNFKEFHHFFLEHFDK